MRLLPRLSAAAGLAFALLQAVPAHAQERPSPEQAQQLQNPIASSPESVAAGLTIFRRECHTCHGRDGKGHTDMVEFLPTPPADLTDAEWTYGATDGEKFVVIRHGAGDSMPAFDAKLSEEETWHVVNYLRELASSASR